MPNKYKIVSTSIILVCKRCGKPFDKGEGWPKYCTECRYKKRGRVCKNCGGIIETNSRSYCSEECRRQVLSRGKILILDRDSFQCIYCGKTSYRDKSELHIDHIIPKESGGLDIASNLVTSCIECNLSKHAMRLFSEEKILEEVRHRNELAGINPNQGIKLTLPMP